MPYFPPARPAVFYVHGGQHGGAHTLYVIRAIPGYATSPVVLAEYAAQDEDNALQFARRSAFERARTFDQVVLYIGELPAWANPPDGDTDRAGYLTCPAHDVAQYEWRLRAQRITE